MEDATALDVIGLRDKRALVTGGGAGIGRSICELLGKLGMRIAVIERNHEHARDLKLRLSSAGIDCLVETADVTDAGAVKKAMQVIEEQFGRLDVLVNNVGDYLGIRGPFSDSTDEQWDSLYRINIRQMFLVTRAAIPLIRRTGEGGSIINLSTIEAFRGIPQLVAYGTFKAAVTGFTQSLAVELGHEGIRVNAIAPESTNTAQIKGTSGVPPENREYMARWFPIGRFGEPEDSAGAAVFLASKRLSGWVSGTTIHVDGGALAAGAWLQLPQGGWTHLPIIECDGYTARR